MEGRIDRLKTLEIEIKAVNRKLDTVISMLWQLIPIDKGIYDDISRRLDKPLRKYKRKSKERIESTEIAEITETIKIANIENREEVNHGNQGVSAQ